MCTGFRGWDSSVCEMFHASFIAVFVHSALGRPALLLSFLSWIEFPKISSSRFENVAILIGSYFSYSVVRSICPNSNTFFALISIEKSLIYFPSASFACDITDSLEILEIHAGSMLRIARSPLCWNVSSCCSCTVLSAEVSSPYINCAFIVAL